MADGVFNANRLFAKIRALGYTRGKTILKEFLKPLRPLQKPNATMRFETKPGEQAQVDFGVFQYEEEGHRRQVYAFVMVMSYSRAMYVEFVERQDVSTLIKCHIHALEYFGGVPGENGCHIEVYAAGVRVALHPRAVIPGTVVPLPGQWDGVPLGSEGGARRALVARVRSVDVEVRSLKVYEAVAEVAEG